MMENRQPTSKLLAFYLGEQRDSAGRRIQDIWAWDFEKLEHTHDFIQWLFPLTERSAYNPNAPIVDAEVVRSFQQNLQLQANLRRSLTVMLHFYGLQRQELEPGKVVITQAANYPNRQPEWIFPSNHNFLRITRILKCLMAFGLENEANAFFDCLKQIYQENRERIGSETFRHWTNAVKQQSH